MNYTTHSCVFRQEDSSKMVDRLATRYLFGCVYCPRKFTVPLPDFWDEKSNILYFPDKTIDSLAEGVRG